MTEKKIRELLSTREKRTVEFKEATFEVPQSLWESVCAFLNGDGGYIILGADNNGIVTGVTESCIDEMKRNISSNSNNSQIINPPFLLFPEEYTLPEGKIIYTFIPASSEVHKHRNDIYNRSTDGDFKVTNPQQIADLYNNKRLFYSEIQIYEHLTFNDFNNRLFDKVKKLIKNKTPDHPWLMLGNENLLKISGLYRKDFQTGKEGYTLASALLFGNDSTIQSILPHYKIDCLVRKRDTDRYDDRVEIRTNLIDSYDLIMDFVSKHLNDKFYMEGGQRIDLREKIFREIASNIIIHSEYTNAQPAQFIIYKDKVEAINACKAHGSGQLSLDTFSPFLKNPLIARFSIQLGRAEEIGSGIINVSKYIKVYTSSTAIPQFVEGPVFKTIIPTESYIFDKAANSILSMLFKDVSIIPPDVIEILKKMEYNTELTGLKDKEDNFLYNLAVRWLNKGSKLGFHKLPDNSSLSFQDSFKGASIYDKGSKLLPRNIRNFVKVIILSLNEKSLIDLVKTLGYKNKYKFKKTYLEPLINNGLLEYTIFSKPKSPKQKYITTLLGKLFLGGFDES